MRTLTKLPWPLRSSNGEIRTFQDAKRLLTFYALVAFLITLSACNLSACSSSECLPEPPAAEDDSSFSTAKFDDVVVDVYVDATLSMQGFVKAGTETRYIQTLQRLENATIKGWRHSEAKFYKFGNRITSFIERQQFLDEFAKPGFYNDPQYRGKTHIEDVVQKADSQNLTIIVTDLFEENSDLNILEKELKTKYILDGLAIGVLGVKSDFDGIIYDIGLSRAVSAFKGRRPFYVLILGKHRDVARLFEQMGPEESSEEHFALFSPNIANQSAALRMATVAESSKLVEDDFLQLGAAPNLRIRQFSLQGEPSRGSFTLKDIQLCPLPHTTPFDVKGIEDRGKFEQDIKAYHYKCGEPPQDPGATNKNFQQKGPAEPVPNGGQQPAAQSDGRNQKHKSYPVPDQDALRALAVEIKAEEKPGSRKPLDQCASVLLKSALEPALLPGSGIYRFDVTLRPKPNAYTMPEWYSKWNMDPLAIESWKRGGKLDGGTTLYLKSFLDSLWTTTLEVHHPSVLKLYIYIRKR